MKYLDLFDRDFSQGLGVRARSFRQVFELLESLHYPPYTIVETGVTNLPVPPLPWKAPSPHGHSSVLFQHFLSHHGGRLYSVDINPEHCAVALRYADDHVEIVCADSRRFLQQRRFQSPINCLYLDSLDIDWGNPHVSAFHHLEELDAAVRKLAPRSLVVVDDSPHLKGKGGYVSDYMARLGAHLLFDNYQAGWLLPDKFYALPVLCNAEQSTSECLAQIIATRWFRYVREGYDERILELCHDHTIGEGNAACEERWFLEPNGNSWTLVFVGQGQITCRLDQSRDGVWKGSWLNYERMPITLTPQDLRRGQHARLAGTWDVVLATGVKNRVEIMPSGNLGFGSRLLGCTWTIDPSEDLVFNSETGVVARFRFSSDRLRAHCVESRNHLKGSTLVRSKPLGFAACRLQELVTQLAWFDAATNTDHWPLELLPNGVIGKGRSHQFQNWDVEELDGIIYLVLSNHDRISRLKQDRSSRRVRFVGQDGLTLRQVDRGRGAYLLPYFTAAIPRSNIRTIVEIGCGDGDDSIALQRFYEADVFAFECNPNFADLCRTRIAGSNRVQFFELGIADRASDGQTFYVTQGKNPSASSFFVANSKYPYENYEQRPVKVATTTLDEWAAAEAGVAGVDLLCMDCQGGALAALRGGEEILSRTQFIVTELATRPIYQDEPLAAEVVAMLRERRFQLIRSLNQWGVTNGGRFYDNPNYDRRYQNLESWFGDYLFKRMSESEQSLADEIIRQRYFLYRRIGSDERLLELLADGMIGAGAEEFELNWMVQDQTDGETHLLILGLNHVTCRLVQESHGRFIGRWLLFEQMPIELVIAASPEHTPVWFPPQFGCTRGQFSQQDEADILLGILELIKGRTNRTFVEIGVGPRYGFDPQIYGLECNCRVLRERGWQGWMFDLNQYPDDFGVIQAHLSAANAVEIFAQNHIPDLIDVLSIDIDGQDYWVWQALGARAQVVCIEYNCSVEGAKVVPEDPDFLWDGTNYFGASLVAMKMLGEQLDYALVHTNNVNAIFVQRSLISNPDEFLHAGFAPVVPIHPADPFGRPWLDLSTFHNATLRPNHR